MGCLGNMSEQLLFAGSLEHAALAEVLQLLEPQDLLIIDALVRRTLHSRCLELCPKEFELDSGGAGLSQCKSASFCEAAD